MLHRIAAIAKNDFRIARRNPIHVIVLIGMPIFLMPFVRTVGRVVLVDEGVRGANGAEQAVPGMATMFAFFLVGLISMAFFGEHVWRTWPRLRVSSAGPLEVVLGKAIVPLAVGALQFAVLFGLGGLLLGLHVRGSILALVGIGLTMTICVIGIGLAASVFCRTFAGAQTVNNLGALLAAGLGGALTPRSTLPGWAQSLSWTTPTYWAMKGYRVVIIDGGGIGDVLVSMAVLGGAGLVLIAAAVRGLDFDDVKLGWS